MVEFADEPDRQPTREEDAQEWLSIATMRRAHDMPQVAMPDVVLDGIIKLMSPPGYLTVADITHNPVVKAAYDSIHEALHGWGPHQLEDQIHG